MTGHTQEACCKYCGRWLVRLHSNGEFDLNSRASATFRFSIPMADYQSVARTGIAKKMKAETVENADCLLVLCVFRSIAKTYFSPLVAAWRWFKS